MRKLPAGHVTMRIRIADNELEVIGPKAFVVRKVEEFLEKARAKQLPTPLPPAALNK